MSWKQEGHVGDTPGFLAFFKNRRRRILHLRLRKRNGLYYCDVTGRTAMGINDAYNNITDNWVMVADRTHTDSEVVGDWATVGSIGRVSEKTVTRGKQQEPYMPLQLPVIPKQSLFEPILDPMAERTFVPDHPVVSQLQTEMVERGSTIDDKRTDVALDCESDDTPKPTRRQPRPRTGVHKPVTPAEQLELELWAARLGFCG